ncbi:unnamed protein product [Rotaria socialis]|uniref:Uncharacterized protein n=1 Tax=Rotaria socialis TaxID=392032 RepID=A0A821CB18_9BILA|nr:unnamed protein product [Rotaria socialis]CAF3492055.1 unnamed protein product [Rotaria socialis]CAF3680042.1 unnamed protein product [Rotaria socialis]CAF3751478.1 unnamed protein product [Rotaria socialis]CAF4249032.1 unnamed protein product [Rotaria socialis]
MSIEDIDAKSVQQFDPYRATGLWHIIATNDNMWKSKLTPTITYSIHENLPDGRVRMNNLVEYYSKQLCVGYRPTSIEGIDTQLSIKPSRYQWRGSGILKLFTNESGFIFVDNETAPDRPYQWIAKIYSPTIFSSGGIDLMTRTRHPPTHVLNDFVQFCRDDSVIRPRSANMFYTREKADNEIYYIRDLQLD